MSAGVLLVIHTVVAIANYAPGGSTPKVVPTRDWRPLGTFVDMDACKEAERLLGVLDRTRCLPGAKPP